MKEQEFLAVGSVWLGRPGILQEIRRYALQLVFECSMDDHINTKAGLSCIAERKEGIETEWTPMQSRFMSSLPEFGIRTKKHN